MPKSKSPRKSRPNILSSSTSRLRRALAMVLVPFIALSGLFFAGTSASAARVADVVVNGSGYTQTFTQPGAEPVVATYSFSGATEARGVVPFPSRGSSPSDFSDSIPEGTPVAEIYTNGEGCVVPGNRDFECINRGVITINFSRPVNNPTLHIAGLGAGAGNPAGNMRFAATGTLSSVPAGATLALAPNASNLQIIDNGTKFQTESNRPDPTCHVVAANANGPAGCGSIQVVGTGITQLSFAMTLKGNSRQAGLAITNDAWALIMSLEDAELPSLAIEKTANIDLITHAGQELIYSFEVENTGNVPITDVAPDEINFGGTGELGPITPESVDSLAPGEKTTFTATYVVTQEDVDAGELVNTASATGTPPSGTELPPVDPSTVTIPGERNPALTIEKTASPSDESALVVGQEIVYTFAVTNTGNVTLTNVAPEETTFSGSGELGPITPASVASLAPDQTAEFTATYVVTQADVDAGSITNAATANGTPPPGTELTPPPPSEVIIPGDRTPGLEIVKSSDTELITEAGQEITYTFQVKNTGNVTLTDVSPVEGDFTGTGELGDITPESVETLAPGEEATFTASYTVTQDDVDAGGVTNTATATGNPPPGTELPPVPPSEVTVPSDRTPALSITKSADPMEESAFVVGEEITYTFVVTNTGNVTLTDVAPVEGDFTGTGELGAITPASANLAPGESAVFTATYTVTQEDVDAGSITNDATATGNPPPGTEFTPPPPSEVTVPGERTPALEIVKTSDTELITDAGQQITYTFQVKNTGNVTITDVAPVEGEFTGTGELGDITPASATLAPGQTAEFTATYTVTQADLNAGELINTATATGTPPEGTELPPVDPSTVTIPGEQQPALTIEKTASPSDESALVVGEEITYTFVVENTGNVTLTDVAPEETNFSGSGELGPITPASVESLAPGEKAEFTATYVVTQADVDAGSITNAATANGNPPPGTELTPPPPSEVTVPGNRTPALSITKSASPSDESALVLGQEITYTFVVENTGNVTLTDVAPEETNFSGSGVLGPITPASVETLAPNETAEFTATYVVTQADVDAGNITNAATANGNPPPGTEFTPPPPSEVTVPGDRSPALEIVKTSETEVITEAGQEITYTFVVTNTGNVTLTDVSPVEGEFTGTGELGAITPESVETLAPGEKAEFTASYTVTQDDVDAGGVTNTATATGTPPTGKELPPVPPSEVTVPSERTPALEIVKSADPMEESAFVVGEEITYTFVVTNTGNVTLSNVAPVEGDFTGSGELGAITPESVDALEPGKSAVFTATYVVTQDDVDAGSITNDATANGNPPPGTELTPPPPSEVTVPGDRSPALEIVKTSDTELITEAGQEITYTFQVKNTGNVTITDVAPVEGEFTGTGTLGAITPTSVAALAPGETAEFTATYTVTQADVNAGGVTNTATATGNPPPGTELPPVPPSEVTVPGDRTPALEIVKSADPMEESAFVVGQEITYTFVVTNTGNVTITDVAPVEGDFTGAGELGAITPASVNSLEPGKSAVFTTTYVVTQADVDAGSVTNNASASGNPPPGTELTPPPPSEVTVPGERTPALEIVKTSDTELITEAGQQITYTFEVKNTGNVTMTEVSPVEGEFTGTGELGAITPESVDFLVPGESAFFTATYVVNQADVNAGGVTNTATATGTPPTGTELPPVPPSEVTVPGDRTPALEIVKSADPIEESAFVVGQEITYTFVVTNTGNVTLNDVAPVEGDFTGAGDLGPITPTSVDSLEPGKSAVFTATYVVTQADVDAGSVTNNATANGNPPPGTELPPTPPSEVTVPGERTPALEIVKTSDTELITAAGQEITYTFQVKNTGNVTMTDVAPVEDEFTGTGELGDITPASVETLAPGQTAEFTATYTVTQADVNAGGVTNTATVTGNPPPGTEFTPPPPSEVTVPGDRSPALEIVKTSDTELITEAGQEITYTFVVKNTGNVTLSDVAPVEGEFTGTGTLGAITPASVETLAPGDTAEFTATYVVTQADVDAGELSNTATATGNPPPGTELPPTPPSEVTVPGERTPALEIVKTSDTELITEAGQEITYTFQVKNTGNVSLTDVVPVEGEFTGTGELGEFTPASATLAPGDEVEFTATYVVTQADLDAGELANTATATGTPPPGTELPPVPPSEVTVPGEHTPALAIEKTSDTEVITEAGQEITYTFQVKNTGNVTMTDVAPVEDEFTGTGELGDITPASVDSLAPGETAEFTATYVVTQEDVDTGGVTNTATATGTPPGDTELPPVPPSEVTVPSDRTPELEVVKSADPSDESALVLGEEITYTFVVTNTGNVTMTDVAPVEGEFTGTGELGAITPAAVDVLAPGESAIFTATYVVTQADVDAGSLTNTATATGTPPGDTELPPVPPSEVTVPSDPLPGLSVVKTSDTELITEPGQEVTYTFQVKNTGNVTITDVAPVEGEFTGTGELGEITPASVDSLVPGESAFFTASYVVTQADVDAGNLTNTATATGTPPTGTELPPTPPSEVTVPSDRLPGLAVVKTSDTEIITEAGQEITYTFEVTNTGNVTITDVAPVEGEFTGTGELGEITPASVESLAPGESALFTATYTVTKKDLKAGSISNTATATGTPPSGTELPEVPPSEISITVNAPALPSTGVPGAALLGATSVLIILGGLLVAWNTQRNRYRIALR